jgi:Uma2 family endonuclease
MVSQLKSDTQTNIDYPDSDGKPMSDNTVQYRWITTIKSNLDWLFAQDDQVFIAGDLLWYPVEGDNKTRQAPDVMVAFGRPKGDRGSYKQWVEENIAPEVVFEILSPGNTVKEMHRKLLFYQRYGVEEYYIYDPQRNECNGLIKNNGELEVIETMENWVSPRLGIKFSPGEPELKLYHPNGELFSTYTEEKQRAESEKQRAESEKQRAESEKQRAEAEKQRADKLMAKLRELGVDLDEK